MMVTDFVLYTFVHWATTVYTSIAKFGQLEASSCVMH